MKLYVNYKLACFVRNLFFLNENTLSEFDPGIT